MITHHYVFWATLVAFGFLLGIISGSMSGALTELIFSL